MLRVLMKKVLTSSYVLATLRSFDMKILHLEGRQAVFPVDVQTHQLIVKERSERLREEARPSRSVGWKRERRADDQASRALLARALRAARV
jgi:hypothetical protein